MTRQNNLKVLAFIGDNSEAIIHYLTAKGYPKVSFEDMPTQIQHLSQAGQHRIVTNQITTFDAYTLLKHHFPGEVHLVADSSEENKTHQDELMSHVNFFVENNPQAIDKLLTKLEFEL